MTDVKSQVNKRKYNGGGFDEHPEHINKNRELEKAWWWKEVLTREVMKKQEGQLKRELMAEAQVDKAISGDTQAFNAIADRMEGKPTQNTDLTSGGKPILSVPEIIAAIEASKNA